MSYAHIDNLYKDQRILAFRQCYALEKVHGTSAHVARKAGVVQMFAGGCDHKSFADLFDVSKLAAGFAAVHPDADIVVFGEAYGGKCQGMAAAYGKELRFIAFDVRIGETWLSVPAAFEVTSALGLEFVPFELISTDLKALDDARVAPSVVAVRRGCGDRPREGVVLRPPFECRDNRGRICAKHKAETFRETRSPRPADPEKVLAITAGQAVADEWVTEMRLTHVLGKLGEVHLEDMKRIIDAMCEDVVREGAGEIVWTDQARRAVASRTATMFKARLQARMRECHGEVQAAV